MKTTAHLGFCYVVFAATLSVQAQLAFNNLDFEQASPVPIVGNPNYPYAVSPSSALPDWSGSINGVPLTQVMLNTYSFGAASVDLFGPGWNNVNPGIIEGNDAVFLQAFFPSQGNVSIWQTGTVPADAESLRYKAWSFIAPDNTLSISFGGNTLSPVLISSGQSSAGQDYDVYGVNIAPYAGQTGQLEFSAMANGTETQVELDDITFSTTTVTPEPNTLALAVTGALALAVGRWRANRS
jgi:hypothetical protein